MEYPDPIPSMRLLGAYLFEREQAARLRADRLAIDVGDVLDQPAYLRQPGIVIDLVGKSARAHLLAERYRLRPLADVTTCWPADGISPVQVGVA